MRFRRWQSAFAMSLALVAVACGQPEPSIVPSEQSPTTPPAIVPSAAPATALPSSVTIISAPSPSGSGAASESWSQIDGGAFHDGPTPADCRPHRCKTLIHRVVGTERGALVLGRYRDAAAVWASEDDLRTWTRLTLPGAPPGSASVAAASGGGVRVVAGRGEVEGAGYAQLWRSVAGGPWQAVPMPPEAFPPGSIIREMTWADGTFVAVGGVFASDPEMFEAVGAAAWVSADGRHWQRASLPLPPGAVSTLYRVASGPGGFVAGGQVSVGRTIDALLVFSPDGRSWEAPQPEGLGGGQDESLVGLAASAATWLAKVIVVPPICKISGCITKSGRILTSVDGRSWELVQAGEPGPAALGATGEELLGVEFVDPESRILSSTDGLTWVIRSEPFTRPDDVTIGSWAVTRSGIIVAGYAAEAGEVMVWVHE